MSKEVPKRIYSFWLQGADQAPEIVQFNWRCWRQLNPDYELIVLDGEAAKNTLSDLPEHLQNLIPQTYSDILRYHLLKTFGGIWVDATVFPVRPLSDWLPGAIDGSDFFTFSFPDEHRLLDNWFLVARPGSLVMERWFATVLEYWSCERRMLGAEDAVCNDAIQTLEATRKGGSLEGRYQYFWSHYLFAELVQTDPEFKRSWQRMNKIAIGPATAMQWYFLRNEQPIRSLVLSILPSLHRSKLKGYSLGSPVHKLNWRKSYPTHLLEAISSAIKD